MMSHPRSATPNPGGPPTALFMMMIVFMTTMMMMIIILFDDEHDGVVPSVKNYPKNHISHKWFYLNGELCFG